MHDYIGYLWAQERMREQMGERVPSPNFGDLVPARRARKTEWRRHAAKALRTTADRLEPSPPPAR